MSLLKDVVIEAIRRMPESVTAKDIIRDIRLINDIIEEFEASGEMITKEELLERVNLKTQEC